MRREIANRFHLCQNLRDHEQTWLDRRHTCLPYVEDSSLQGSTTLLPDDLAAHSGKPTDEVGGLSSELTKDKEEDRLVSISQEVTSGEPSEPQSEDIGLNAAERKKKISRDKRYARYEAVQALHRQGLGLRAIARQLGLSRKAVRHFVTSARFPGTPSRLWPACPWLREADPLSFLSSKAMGRRDAQRFPSVSRTARAWLQRFALLSQPLACRLAERTALQTQAFTSIRQTTPKPTTPASSNLGADGSAPSLFS
jgi:hypothetical protein